MAAECVVKSAGNAATRVAPTVLTIRSRGGHFLVTAFDFDRVRLKTRRQARDWCAENYPGAPIYEAGAEAIRRATKSKTGCQSRR